jgi:tetratricopeptide (TPR) repeat protein
MKKIVCLFVVVAVLASCKSERDKDIELIEREENELFGESGMIDRTRIAPLLEMYVSFADNHPDDTLSPVYLFKAGDMAMNTNRSVQAIQLYSRIIEQYPEYTKVPEALFLKGYVYENNLGRLDKAREIYEEFLQRFPENDFADDAEVSLRYLGMSPEELIEIFQQKSMEEN